AAILVDRRGRARSIARPEAATDAPVPAQGPAAQGPAQQPVPVDIRRFAIVVAFVSGVTSLGYQVLWTRMLASGSGNSTYVFTLILGTFLVGLSVGAAFVARRAARSTDPIAWLGGAQIAVSAIALAVLPIMAATVGS